MSNFEVKFTKKQVNEINNKITDHCIDAVDQVLSESDTVYEVIETIICKHLENNPQVILQTIELTDVFNGTQFQKELTTAVENAIDLVMTKRRQK